MGTIGALTAGVMVLGWAGAAAAASPAASAEGVWRTPEDHGVVQVTACGDAICGAVLGSDRLNAHPEETDKRNQDPSLRGRPLKGMTIFYGLKGGPPVWSGGSVYNPNDGRTYHGSITLVNADTLKLTGCVFAPLCKSEIWTRIR